MRETNEGLKGGRIYMTGMNAEEENGRIRKYIENGLSKCKIDMTRRKTMNMKKKNIDMTRIRIK